MFVHAVAPKPLSTFGRHELIVLCKAEYIGEGARAVNDAGPKRRTFVSSNDIIGLAGLLYRFATAGKLSNPKEVDVEFGEANIGQLDGGKLSIKFSEGTVNKLSGNVKTNLEFSQVKLTIDNDLKSLDLSNSYSTIYLDVEKNLSAAYEITSSHGEFTNKTSFAIKDDGKDDDNRYGPRFTRKYSGTSGSGTSKLKVNSSFGEIIIGHDLKMEKSDKHRSKPEKTT